MFSVYGETGRLFKGAMEELRHIEAVRAVARSRAIEPVNRFPTGGRSQQQTAPEPQAPASHTNALAAYAQTASVQAPRHPLTRVTDVMSHGVFTVPASMSVQQAWQLLFERGISQAPAVDGRDVLVGLFTRGELLHPEHLPLPGSNALAWRALMMQPVASIMHSPVPAVAEETDIRHVARVLLDTHLPGLPVVNDAGTVTGFVSRTDILRAVVHDPPLDLWS